MQNSGARRIRDLAAALEDALAGNSGTRYVLSGRCENLGHLALLETERARDAWLELRERLPPGAEPSIALRRLEAITIARLQKQ